MKKILTSLTIFCLFILLVFPSQAKAVEVLLADLTLTADCSAEASPENFYWELEWNDSIPSRTDGEPDANESFYKLEAPCKVFNGDTFEVRITATDTECNTYNFGATIADVWSLTDELLEGPQSTTTVDSGNSWVNDINVYPSGVWQNTYTLMTPGPFNRRVTFSAKDLGHCWGGHNWTTFVSGDIVVDPERGGSENSAPEATLLGGGVYELGTTLRLRAMVSDDDGDELIYRLLDNGSIISSGTVQAVAGGSNVALPINPIGNGLSLGGHVITLTVSDGTDSVDSSIRVVYIDSVAPNVSLSADPGKLWPPNNDMIPVLVTINATDNSNETPTLSVNVSSTGGSSVIVSVDEDAGTAELSLKASSNKNTVYTVTVTAEDASGNSAEASVEIPVVHESPDRRDFGRGHKK